MESHIINVSIENFEQMIKGESKAFLLFSGSIDESG
jgi:hypothetical protein